MDESTLLLNLINRQNVQPIWHYIGDYDPKRPAFKDEQGYIVYYITPRGETYKGKTLLFPGDSTVYQDIKDIQVYKGVCFFVHMGRLVFCHFGPSDIYAFLMNGDKRSYVKQGGKWQPIADEATAFQGRIDSIGVDEGRIMSFVYPYALVHHEVKRRVEVVRFVAYPVVKQISLQHVWYPDPMEYVGRIQLTASRILREGDDYFIVDATGEQGGARLKIQDDLLQLTVF